MPNTITVPNGSTLAQAFPNYLYDPEQAVYDVVNAAAAPGASCKLPYFADGRANQPKVEVVRGWPAYPGSVPAIGIAAGTESEDKQRELASGGFAEDLIAYSANGALVGSASYYAEPLYAPVVVELIHENRDERDRLHDQLRLVLF